MPLSRARKSLRVMKPSVPLVGRAGKPVHPVGRASETSPRSWCSTFADLAALEHVVDPISSVVRLIAAVPPTATSIGISDSKLTASGYCRTAWHNYWTDFMPTDTATPLAERRIPPSARGRQQAAAASKGASPRLKVDGHLSAIANLVGDAEYCAQVSPSTYEPGGQPDSTDGGGICDARRHAGASA